LEYLYHFSRDGRSMLLNFHCRRGSAMRARKRRSCSLLLTSSQNLINRMPLSTMVRSNDGHRSRNSRYCCLLQKPITCSTPARLYQLRAKMTISPAAGKCATYRCRYIWLFSRSDGAGSATSRKTRGLTRSVIALIVPPLPAASRPSNTTITRSPFSRTQSWRAHSSICRVRSSLSYSWRFIGLSAVLIGLVSSLSRVRIPASPRTEYAKDQVFRLHHDEEQEAPEHQPQPVQQLHICGAEQLLQRRRVSEQHLQDHDRADAQRQIRVAEMRLERQRGVEQVATVEQVEDLTDGNGID